MSKTRKEMRIRRRKRVRKSVNGTAERPRLSDFRSTRYLFAQAIDDDNNKVLAALWEKTLKPKKDEKQLDRAHRFGTDFGVLLKKKKVKTVVFDRGGYKYHGRVKQFADAVRKSGVKF